MIRNDFGLCGSSVLCDEAVVNIPVHIVVCAQIVEQLLHKMRETKNLSFTGAAQRPVRPRAIMTYGVRLCLLDMNCSSGWLEH
jgi:hypothetical protein